MEDIMQTCFEIVAKAYPLHVQRIAEAVYEQHPGYLNEFFSPPDYPDESPENIIIGLFVFDLTPEGYYYWSNLIGMYLNTTED
jgi:hypothetical protein